MNTPMYAVAVLHHWNRMSGPTPEYDLYMFRYECAGLGASLLRFALELFVAGLFYRCGPAVNRFLGLEEAPEPTEAGAG